MRGIIFFLKQEGSVKENRDEEERGRKSEGENEGKERRVRERSHVKSC